MNSNEPGWTGAEKKIARAAYDMALERAQASILAEFKRRATAATTLSEMWEVEDYLKEQRRDLDRMFDYRYSQLIIVFAALIRRGHLDENLLSGLSAEKRQEIRHMLEWHARG